MPSERRELSLATVAADAAPALVAGLCVTPVVASVDKATVENTAGRASLLQSFGKSMLAFSKSPASFLGKPMCRYILGVYGGTYFLNNLFTSFEECQAEKMPLTKSSTIFVGNSALSLWKDSAFARLFGTGARTSPPASALACWWSRDFISMAVIFVGPSLVAQELSKLSGGKINVQSAELYAQLTLPFLLQPFITPLHLVGFIRCNEPNSSLATQMTQVRQQLASTTALRWVRGIPPYSLGTVANKRLRTECHGRLQATAAVPAPAPVSPLATAAIATTPATTR